MALFWPAYAGHVLRRRGGRQVTSSYADDMAEFVQTYTVAFPQEMLDLQRRVTTQVAARRNSAYTDNWAPMADSLPCHFPATQQEQILRMLDQNLQHEIELLGNEYMQLAHERDFGHATDQPLQHHQSHPLVRSASPPEQHQQRHPTQPPRMPNPPPQQQQSPPPHRSRSPSRSLLHSQQTLRSQPTRPQVIDLTTSSPRRRRLEEDARISSPSRRQRLEVEDAGNRMAIMTIGETEEPQQQQPRRRRRQRHRRAAHALQAPPQPAPQPASPSVTGVSVRDLFARHAVVPRPQPRQGRIIIDYSSS